MNILFLTSSLSEIYYAYEFSRPLMKGLLSYKHKVGFFSNNNSDYEELGEIKDLVLLKNTESNKYKWDLIIIQNSSTFIYFETIINQINAPIIFICHSSYQTDKIILHKNLFKVINVHGNIENRDWGFPDELIAGINFPVEIEKPQQFEDRHLPYKALFINNNDKRLETLRSIIITFGTDRAKKYSVTIHGCENSSLFEDHNSGNIKFAPPKDNVINYIKNADLVIGSGTIAYKAILMNKPFIVAGIRGFGGLVTPDNLHVFMINNFEGRIGAELYEMIPPRILGQEINNINFDDMDNIKHIVSGNRKLLEELSDFEIVTERFIKICEESLNLFQNISNTKLLLHLRPQLASNIIIKTDKDNSSCYLIRNPFNTTVAKIKKDTVYLLNDLNGKQTVEDVMRFHDLYNEKNCDLFTRMLKTLWEEKVIIFN